MITSQILRQRREIDYDHKHDRYLLVLVTPVIPAVVLSWNPDFVRFLKAGYPIKAFGYDKTILHDKRLLISYSRNCQTLGVHRQHRGFTLGQLFLRTLRSFSAVINECFHRLKAVWCTLLNGLQHRATAREEIILRIIKCR